MRQWMRPFKNTGCVILRGCRQKLWSLNESLLKSYWQVAINRGFAQPLLTVSLIIECLTWFWRWHFVSCWTFLQHRHLGHLKQRKVMNIWVHLLGMEQNTFSCQIWDVEDEANLCFWLISINCIRLVAGRNCQWEQSAPFLALRPKMHTFVSITPKFQRSPFGLQNSESSLDRYVCGIWFLFHVLQLLPIIFIYRNLCCICKAMMQHQRRLDWKSNLPWFRYMIVESACLLII